jgi:hypothetical protein
LFMCSCVEVLMCWPATTASTATLPDTKLCLLQDLLFIQLRQLLQCRVHPEVAKPKRSSLRIVSRLHLCWCKWKYCSQIITLVRNLSNTFELNRKMWFVIQLCVWCGVSGRVELLAVWYAPTSWFCTLWLLWK